MGGGGEFHIFVMMKGEEGVVKNMTSHNQNGQNVKKTLSTTLKKQTCWHGILNPVYSIPDQIV